MMMMMINHFNNCSWGTSWDKQWAESSVRMGEKRGLSSPQRNIVRTSSKSTDSHFGFNVWKLLASVRDNVFYILFRFQKHDFLRFLEMMCQKVVKSR